MIITRFLRWSMTSVGGRLREPDLMHLNQNWLVVAVGGRESS